MLLNYLQLQIVYEIFYFLVNSIISSIIGNQGGNIIDVSHHRLFTELPAKETYSNITLETRDAQHLQDILSELREEGFVVNVNRNIEM